MSWIFLVQVVVEENMGMDNEHISKKWVWVRKMRGFHLFLLKYFVCVSREKEDNEEKYNTGFLFFYFLCFYFHVMCRMIIVFFYFIYFLNFENGQINVYFLIHISTPYSMCLFYFTFNTCFRFRYDICCRENTYMLTNKYV